MIDAKLKQDWLDALRSDDYKQGKGSLKSYGRYCCLGVLAVVAGLPFKASENCQRNIDDGTKWGSYDPLEKLITKHHVNELWHMNDIEDKTFNQIADWIEKNIPGE